MKGEKQILFILFVISKFIVCADEGMWLPLLLEKSRYADMQAKGLKITADDIYSINHTSLKDAVCLFGGGCTAGVVSDKGLIITNHHCGYGAIQDHSTPEKDYLTDGFWAMSADEELINKSLTVTFLVRMEDVTSTVLGGISDEMEEKEKHKIISGTIADIVKKAKEGTHYNASVKSFYYGNEYYLFVTEVFKDVRLVGAPPSGIGKFGGDTDNWMWPRHTGDFSVFRIYADTYNKPAVYNISNVPYRPGKSLSVSLSGIKKDDFTFVYGFPAQTQEYITSYAAGYILNQSDLNKVKLRQKILDIIKSDMEHNSLVRLQYSAKAAGISNGWKKWIGEMNGLKRLSTIQKKQDFERQFTAWLNTDSTLRKKYGSLLGNFKTVYEEIAPYSLARDYVNEAVYQIEIVKFAQKFAPLVSSFDNGAESSTIMKETERLKNEADEFFKDYNQGTDKKLFIALLEMYYRDIPKEFRPELIDKNYSDGFAKYAEKVFDKSIFNNREYINKLLGNVNKSTIRKICKDPAYMLYQNTAGLYNNRIKPKYEELTGRITMLNGIWMKARMEMQPDKLFYPDANQTLRIAYGKVGGYEPSDAVSYNYFTTLEGIMEKVDPEIYDYHVPDRLLDFYKQKDYGQYGHNGTLPVCFTATNHTSGGNSGSPVLNAKGELIGINFDRNWEGTMSDIEYDPEQCRNIVLDIRYALFIIDKFAGATYLINEMKINRN